MEPLVLLLPHRQVQGLHSCLGSMMEVSPPPPGRDAQVGDIG
jgi:hypothetical protein